MSTVTYKHQPGIAASHGNIPLAGTSHLYTVTKVLWPEAVSDVLASLFIGRSLHVCNGLSNLGDCRLDLNAPHPDIRADACRLPFGDRSWDSVLCDPPYNGSFQFNHDLLSELARVAKTRIVFQHWFIPADKNGYFKKDHSFRVSAVYVWQPKSYFGRAQVITVMDSGEKFEEE